jgi:glutamate synthase (NADPH) small chain
VLCTGSRTPRDLPVPGRELDGIHFAMDYLYERQRAVDSGRENGSICATGKHVIVIGGGDTGADCVANATREGAESVVQLELLPEPPPRRPDDKTPWPLWPAKFRLSYAMEEARALGRGVQSFSVVTTHFEPGEDGNVGALHYAHAQDAPPFGPVDGTEDSMPAQLVLLAMGFLHPEQALLDGLGVAKDARNNIAAPVYETSQQGVFAAGDARRGQSLIVWAINEGRQAARMADRYLRSLAPAPVESGNVHDADFGPEGPPQHVSGALVAEE